MTAAAVLARLDALGVAVAARGESLALRPASAVPPALLAKVRECKIELLALLAATDAMILDDVCDAPAIRDDLPMPPPSTVARGEVFRKHRTTIDGLLAASMRRPSSWWNPSPHNPTPGSACSCCSNRRWWSRDRLGWCCSTCHPPPHSTPKQTPIEEILT